MVTARHTNTTSVQSTPRRLQDESGQMLVMSGLFMVVFVYMLGLVLDMGMAYTLQRRMQNAADSAALAGARSMAQQEPEAIARLNIERMLTANGASVALSTYSISSPTAEVTARTAHTTIFLRVFDINEVQVKATATATWGARDRSGVLMPFAVEEDTWTPGQVVQLNPPNNGTSGSGNFGWINWNNEPPAIQTLVNNINNPVNSGEVFIGDNKASGDPGNALNNPQVESALQARIGQIITLPLYDADLTQGSGNNLTYVISGFANFELTKVNRQNNLIQGRFISTITLHGPIRQNNSNGIQTVGLLN